MDLRDLLNDAAFRRRKKRARKGNREEDAYRALARVFAASPDVVLQRLVDTATSFCGADSAGISLEGTNEKGERIFRWVAVSGSFAGFLGGTTPRFFSPCGTTLDSSRPQLYRVTKAYYDYLGIQAEPITDGILIPWETAGMHGTLWCVSQRRREAFDFADYELLDGLASFAAAAIRNSSQQKQLREQESLLAAAAIEKKLAPELERRNAEILEQAELLRELSERLLQTQNEERRHIARELHDSTGQLLALMNMNLSALRKSFVEGNAAKSGQLLEDCAALANEVTSQIRTVSYLLHPPLLDELGLSSALRWLVEGFEQRSQIEVILDVPERFGRLQPELELNLFRIVQESLTNIHRHSSSKTATIRLCQKDGNVLLEIQDQGAGISDERMAKLKARRSGVGIAGMRERIRGFNGILDVSSNKKGTKISVTVPLKASQGSGVPEKRKHQSPHVDTDTSAYSSDEGRR
jgi:signal transduction histidine kinase